MTVYHLPEEKKKTPARLSLGHVFVIIQKGYINAYRPHTEHPIPACMPPTQTLLCFVLCAVFSLILSAFWVIEQTYIKDGLLLRGES